jgi:hypothetical protein
MELSKESSNIELLLDKASSHFPVLTHSMKRQIIKLREKLLVSRSPEKLAFDGVHYRTARLNEAG